MSSSSPVPRRPIGRSSGWRESSSTPFESRFAFTYLTGLRTSALESVGPIFPQHSVGPLCPGHGGRGRRQVSSTSEFLVDRVTAAANWPTYSWVGLGVDHGSRRALDVQKAAIESVGRLGVCGTTRRARGQHFDVGHRAKRRPVDWAGSPERLGIDEERVPAGARVSVREPSLWDRYNLDISVQSAFSSIQSGLIAGLLVQRVRRYRAEGELRTSQEALELVTSGFAT